MRESMTRPECLIKSIEVCENTLAHVTKELVEMCTVPLFVRDSGQNEKIIKLNIKKGHLEVALSWMKFDESNTDHYHVDLPEPTELTIQTDPDSVYRI